MASPALVQSATAASSAASPASIAPSLPVASTVGNTLVLVMLVTGTTPTITNPAGWGVARNATVNSVTTGVFHKTSAGEQSVTVTIGGTGGGSVACLMEFSNVDIVPSGGAQQIARDSIQGSSSASTNAPTFTSANYPPCTDLLVVGYVLFQAATLNNIAGTSFDVGSNIVTNTLVSTAGTPNAQAVITWGIANIFTLQKMTASLGAAVATFAGFMRLYSQDDVAYDYSFHNGVAGAVMFQGA